MDTARYVEIPADKVRDAIRAAYDLSRPVGMGMLHFTPGPLDEVTVEAIATSPHGISMDYVRGRQCKFHVHEADGRYFVSPQWYDHSDYQLVELLTAIGIADPRGAIDAALKVAA